jgi:2'-5' RNA ligase
MRLQKQIANRMARHCLVKQEDKDRPYHPHITLARFHGHLRLSNNQSTLPASLQRSFSANTVNLYRSNLTPTGPHYEILSERRLP